MGFIVVPAGLSLRLRAAPAYSPAKSAAYAFSRIERMAPKSRITAGHLDELVIEERVVVDKLEKGIRATAAPAWGGRGCSGNAAILVETPHPFLYRVRFQRSG